MTSVPCLEECNGDKALYKEMFNTFIASCSIDYNKMSKAMESLTMRLKNADRVRIIAKDTDISFSIKDLPAIKCIGTHNLPDGELFTAPVKGSVNGVITYNLPSKNNGIIHENVRLEFKNGKIINQTSNHPEELQEIFAVDEGARYIGEFAIGVNPYISNPMKDTLFDEKIKGSFHFTPGNCYDDAYNGNSSAIHWDLVCIQTPEYGGGEIYFDDVLIRKDGLFVVPQLECLNPENLAK